MKLLKFRSNYNYGKDYYLSLLTTKQFSFLQLVFSLCEDNTGWPYLQVSIGEHKFFGFFCYVWRIGLEISVIGRTWRWL